MTDHDDELVRFLRAQHPRVAGTLQLILGDVDVADELTAETMARVVRDWRRIRGLSAPGPYVHRIAVNLANSRFRRLAAQRRALARHGADEDTHRDHDTADVLAVREAVAALPVRQRECVALHHFADLPTDAVADALGIRPATVRSHLRDARAALRVALGDDVDLPADEQPRRRMAHRPTTEGNSA